MLKVFLLRTEAVATTQSSHRHLQSDLWSPVGLWHTGWDETGQYEDDVQPKYGIVQPRPQGDREKDHRPLQRTIIQNKRVKPTSSLWDSRQEHTRVQPTQYFTVPLPPGSQTHVHTKQRLENKYIFYYKAVKRATRHKVNIFHCTIPTGTYANIFQHS